MSNNYFYTFLKSIKNIINEEFPEIKDVKIVTSNFNKVKDIKEVSENESFLRIGLSKLSPILNTNTNQLEIAMNLGILFAIKDDANSESKYQLPLETLEKILLLVKYAKWTEAFDNTFITDQKSIEAENYDIPENLTNDNVIWQVNWQQKCILGVDRFYKEGLGKLPDSWLANIIVNKDKEFPEQYEGKIKNNK